MLVDAEPVNLAFDASSTGASHLEVLKGQFTPKLTRKLSFIHSVVPKSRYLFIFDTLN